MPDRKISQYPNSVTKRPKGTDLLDISENDGGGGFESKKMLYSIIERDIGVIAEKTAVDLDDVVGTETTLVFTSAGKKVIPTKLILIAPVGGKPVPNAKIRVNKVSQSGDIIPEIALTAFINNNVFVYNIEGVLPSPILTDSDDIFFEIREQMGIPFLTEVLLFGTSQDV